MSDKWKIPRRLELEVYITEHGEIALRQESSMPADQEDAVVVMERDEALQIAGWLHDAVEELDRTAELEAAVRT